MFSGIGKTFTHRVGRMMIHLHSHILRSPIRNRIFASSLVVASMDPFSEERRKRIVKVFSLVQARQSECFDAVFAACKERKWKQIEDIREDCDELVNAKGRSILLEAFEQGELELAEELIKRNIALHLPDGEGNGVAHYAIKNGCTFLLPWEKLDINACNKQGQTPLHIAAEKGDEKAIADLIAYGANIDARGRLTIGDAIFEEVTPLHIAIIYNHIGCIDILLDHFVKCSDPLISLPKVGSLLHIAIHFRQRYAFRHLLTTHFERVKSLLNATNQEGRTPIMEASFQGDGEALVFLKEKGADLEARDPKGRTALHWAAIGRQHTTIDLLCYYGCDLNAADDDNERPFDLMREYQDSASQSIANHLKNLQSQRKRLPPFLYAIYPPENLVFKGGGPKGIAYVGAMKALEQENALRDLLRVAGTSAGAINATLIACGYHSEELEAVLRETDLTSFLDHPLKKKRIEEALNNITFSQSIEGIYRIYKTAKDNASIAIAFKKLWGTTGLCKGEAFRQWIEGYIQRKTGIKHCTFGELTSLINQGKPFKHLHIFTTRMDDGQFQHINSEDPQWKDVIISDAVRASMSIPGVFDPHVLHEKKDGRRLLARDLGVHVDGGLIRNFPIEAFDKRKYRSFNPREGGEFHIINDRTLGLRLYSPKEKQLVSDRNVETIGDLLSGILLIYLNAEELLQEQTFDNQFRTILIDNRGVGTTEFHLTEAKKRDLITSGEHAVKRFYTNHRKLSTKENNLMDIVHIAYQAKYGTNIEVLPEDFIERDSHYLGELSQRFFQKDSPLIQVLLWGFQGNGKSSIALDFANRNIERFSLVWKIDCEKESDIRRSYHDLAKALGIRSKEDEPLERLQRKVHYLLESQKRDNPYLLIFDNAEKVPALPKKGGCILMTSREKIIWRGSNPIEVRPFTPKEAEDLLVNTLEEDDRKAFAILAKELGYHPSTIAQIANYIATTPGMTTRAFLEILKTETKNALKLTRIDDRYPVSTVASWKIIQESLEKSHPEALDWLQCCAYLSPDAIPIHWVDIWLQEKNDQTSLIKRGEILRVLTEKGFVHYDQQKQTISLHRLRQHLCQILIGDDKKEVIIDKTLQLLLDVAEDINYRKHSSLTAGIHLSPHTEAILSQHLKPSAKVANLSSHLGDWMQNIGRYGKGVEYHKKAYEIRQNILGDHKDTAWDLSGIGICLSKLGRYEEAFQFHVKALEMRMEILGDQDKNALEMRRKKLGDQDSVFIASSLHNIAANKIRSAKQGEHIDKKAYLDALKLLEKACGTAVDALGQEDPFVGMILETAGACFLQVGQIIEEEYASSKEVDEFREIYRLGYEASEKTLEIYRKTLGSHPRLIVVLNNLGNCKLLLENPSQALPHFKEACEIYEKHEPALVNHTITTLMFNNTGKCYLQLNDYKEALRYLKKAFIISCVPGSSKQHRVIVIENVIETLKKLNNDKINLETKKELLSLCEEHLGKDDERTRSLAHMKAQSFWGCVIS